MTIKSRIIIYVSLQLSTIFHMILFLFLLQTLSFGSTGNLVYKKNHHCAGLKKPTIMAWLFSFRTHTLILNVQDTHSLAQLEMIISEIIFKAYKLKARKSKTRNNSEISVKSSDLPSYRNIHLKVCHERNNKQSVQPRKQAECDKKAWKINQSQINFLIIESDISCLLSKNLKKRIYGIFNFRN